MKSMKSILAGLAVAITMMIGTAPAQAAPLTQARAIEVTSDAAVTEVGYRNRRFNRHYGHRNFGRRHYGRRHFGLRNYGYSNYGYRNYGYRNYGFYPNHTFGGLSFHIGPRFRHY
ncbi:MAG: hypothetical protein SH859_02095 [Hyphomicrobium aestuarii]|nr:hypothetical protein [Hyphomicrobium aestuarii]